MMAMGAGIVLGSENDAQRHTMEYGDQATRNMTIITMDICQQNQRRSVKVAEANQQAELDTVFTVFSI